MNIIIIGGSHTNKGAQTMLFITVYEIMRRYPTYNIYYCDKERKNNVKGNLKFNYLCERTFIDALRCMTKRKTTSYKIYKNFYSFVRNIKNNNLVKEASIDYAKAVIEKTCFVIDVSGYAVSSKFYKGSRKLLGIIDMLHSLSVPIVLMPQSFGPFDYEDDIKDKMQQDIRRVLRYPEMIFAREKAGYKILKEYGIENLELSSDLVLQNRFFDIGTIADVNRVPTSIPNVKTNGNVAIIPNEKVLINSRNEDEFYAIYALVIKTLLELGKNIYLVWHSNEDFKICQKIKGMISSDHLYIVEEELNFWQFEKYIENFDYAVASRFHSIIHSFKHGIPCIGLGWAVKYQELFASCSQQEYVFDVSDEDKLSKIVDAIKKMDANYINESRVITEHVSEIQKNNCFDKLFEIMDKKLSACSNGKS